jgi:hypothetical protein
MLPVSHRGSTHSRRMYLPDYITGFPQEQQASLIEKYKHSEIVELNTLFAGMSITPKTNKTISDHCAPVLTSRYPIVYPTNYAKEYSIDCDLIAEVRKPHLMFFDTLYGTFKLKDVSRGFVLL